MDSKTSASWIRRWAERREKKRAEKRAKARSDTIDLTIEEEAKTFKKRVNVLFLRTNASEESALIRHMKFTQGNGHYSSEELADFRRIIWKNLVERPRKIVQALQDLGLEPVNDANKANCEHIMNHRTDVDDPEFSFLPEFVQAVQDLWADDIIPVLSERSSELPLGDDTSYLFNRAHRITARGYIPSHEDILRAAEAEEPVVGVRETSFVLGELTIQLCDVGGQLNERKKWIHQFEGVTSVIFCVSLSDYDQRLTHSLVLFDSVINSRWFMRTSIILFLTGVDKFKAKLAKVPLDRYFPEYTGGSDVNKGAKYILWRFMQANRARLTVYPHITQASDSGNIRLLFTAVKETVLQNALRESGILRTGD